MKRKQNRESSDFTYKTRKVEITGKDDNKHLIRLAYLRELRPS